MSPRVIAQGRVNGGFVKFSRSRRIARRLAAQGLDVPAEHRTKAEFAWWNHAVGEEGDAENRVLSKASGAAGSFLVPQDFYEQVVAVIRDRGSVAKVALEIQTAEGRTLPLPELTAHGSGAWTSENAATTVSDDTFGLLNLSAYKAATLSVVSEELLADSGVPLDTYLAGEFGGRLALLEGAA